jgi:hypothetical protein
MKTKNEPYFEQLGEEGYYISNNFPKAKFKDLTDFPDALGFDYESGGFLALHKGHQAGGIADEIRACLLLKSKGYAVELLDESAATGIEPDAKINGAFYDIKRLYKSKNHLERLAKLFRKVGYMKIDRIVLHIDQNIKRTDLESLLSTTASRRPAISHVLLIFQNEVYEIARQDVIDKNWGVAKA